ncbi:Hsp20 family protein [Allorhizobium undicola]|uniref:Hsp20 family protein n=1 Tax=Allorhizobium undicola TaxID=78527 RepID=UPI003D33C00F
MRRLKPVSTPLLLGFDFTEALAAQLARANDGYPPYNIELLREAGVHRLRITLAVAGFSEHELDVTVEGRQLIISGAQAERADADYLFRGIAARQFQRVFVMAEGMDVAGAQLRNGLLAIELERPEPQDVVRKINISASK